MYTWPNKKLTTDLNYCCGTECAEPKFQLPTRLHGTKLTQRITPLPHCVRPRVYVKHHRQLQMQTLWITKKNAIKYTIKANGKVVPFLYQAPCHESIRKNVGTAPHIPNLRTRWRGMTASHQGRFKWDQHPRRPGMEFRWDTERFNALEKRNIKCLAAAKNAKYGSSVAGVAA